MDDLNKDKWNRAVTTLHSMCTSELMGRGPTGPAFIHTLRMYADQMELLLQPVRVESVTVTPPTEGYPGIEEFHCVCCGALIARPHYCDVCG